MNNEDLVYSLYTQPVTCTHPSSCQHLGVWFHFHVNLQCPSSKRHSQVITQLFAVGSIVYYTGNKAIDSKCKHMLGVHIWPVSTTPTLLFIWKCRTNFVTWPCYCHIQHATVQPCCLWYDCETNWPWGVSGITFDFTCLGHGLHAVWCSFQGWDVGTLGNTTQWVYHSGPKLLAVVAV